MSHSWFPITSDLWWISPLSLSISNCPGSEKMSFVLLLLFLLFRTTAFDFELLTCSQLKADKWNLGRKLVKYKYKRYFLYFYPLFLSSLCSPHPTGMSGQSQVLVSHTVSYHLWSTYAKLFTKLKHSSYWGTWLAQSLEHVTLSLRVVSSNPTLGIEIT